MGSQKLGSLESVQNMGLVRVKYGLIRVKYGFLGADPKIAFKNR